MGMGNYACSADAVEEDFVREQCPKTLDELEEILEEVDINFDSFAQWFDERQGCEPDLTEIAQEKIKEAYFALQKDFEQKTGLELYVAWSVDSENADRGCEVTNGFWSVEGVRALTEAGRKWQDKIIKVSWTVFG
jgi:hypothetical protein